MLRHVRGRYTHYQPPRSLFAESAPGSLPTTSLCTWGNNPVSWSFCGRLRAVPTHLQKEAGTPDLPLIPIGGRQGSLSQERKCSVKMLATVRSICTFGRGKLTSSSASKVRTPTECWMHGLHSSSGETACYVPPLLQGCTHLEGSPGVGSQS